MVWSTRSATERLALARGALSVLLALAVALAPLAAHATPADDAKAKALFKEGEKAYNVGDFEGALAKYQEAYQLSPLPGFLFNMAQCYRQLGNFERASFMYGRFIDLSKPKAPNVEMAARLKAEMDALLDALVDNYFPLMDWLAEKVDDLEETIFNRADNSVLEELFLLRKELMRMRRLLAPTRYGVMGRDDVPVAKPHPRTRAERRVAWPLLEGLGRRLRA